MSRSSRIKKRSIPSDPVYNSRLVTRLVNRVMQSGKKQIAFKLVYQALEDAGEQLKQKPLEVIRRALDNIKPNMEVRPRRVGGAAYQVPMPIKGDRRTSLSLRWLVEAARKRPNKDYPNFAKKLTAEIVDAYNRTGGAIKKKEDVHRMAEANKAFSHFRW